MKQNAYKIIRIAILILIIVILLFSCFMTDKRDPVRIAKVLCLFIPYTIAVFTFGKRRSVNKKNYKIYRDKYADIIGDAFADDRRNYQILMRAIYRFNTDKHEYALNLLKSLEPECVSVSDHSAVLMFRALILTDQGLLNEAVSTYEELLTYDVRNSGAWSNLGILYNQLGKTDMARQAYESAVSNDIENAYAYNNLAAFYIQTGNAENALKNALIALDKNAKLYQAMSAAAISYKMLGNEELSEKYYKMYEANGGDSVNLRKILDKI